MSELKEKILYAGRYFRTFYRWLLLATVVGAVCGLVGTAFNLAVTSATEIRQANPWLIFLLPAAPSSLPHTRRFS